MSKRPSSNSKGFIPPSSTSKHAKTTFSLVDMLAEITKLEKPEDIEKRALKLREDVIKEWNKGKNRDMKRVEIYLEAAKVLLTKLRYLPLSISPEAVESDMLVARDILEIGARFSVAKTESTSDPEGIKEFERYISQLKHYYFDMKKCVKKPSVHMYEILGMNLLNLLSQNKMANFHMELELFHPNVEEVLQNPYIKKAVEIEQCITEGQYNKIYELQKAKPEDLKSVGLTSPGFKYFVDHLESTLREHTIGIADTIGAAYTKLPMHCAMQLLNLNDSNKMANIIRAQNWVVKEGHIYFQTKKDNSDEIPAEELLKNALMYADEMDTIV